MANQNIFSHVNRHFRRRIGSGIAALIPIGFTLFILHFLFDSITAIVLPVAKPFTGTLPYYAVALISLAATFLFVYLCGLVAAHIAGQKMLAAGEALILKVPVAKSIYAASKQMVHVLAGGTTSSFQEVVVYDFPRPGNKAVGFVTGSIKEQSSGLKYLNVFTPATPNPTTGFLVLVPETGVTFTDVSIEEGMRMIISGGVLTPASLASVERQKKKERSI